MLDDGQESNNRNGNGVMTRVHLIFEILCFTFFDGDDGLMGRERVDAGYLSNFPFPF